MEHTVSVSYPYGPKNGGSNKSDVMYAGEKTNIGWKVEAKSVPTRRVTDYSAVGLVVQNNVTNAAALNNGLAHQPNDPCTYFRSRTTLINNWCAEFGDNNGDGLSVVENNVDGLAGASFQKIPNKDGAFTKQLDIAVPDNVGGKYCNSYGYKWGYWWGVAKAETGDGLTDDIASWTHVGGKDYWTNYSPACRTIAKKPNMALWDGSLFSGGGVASSTASRHNSANAGQPTKLNDDSSKTTYGSWAENLVVAGSEVSKFASSGAYGAGLPGLVKGNDWPMAWQTISNVGLVAGEKTLGYSEINYNSSYSTQLSAYLKSHATNQPEEQNSTELAGIAGATGTQIYYFNPGGNGGTLKITGNVELANASYGSIYEMPQVVIYVDRNVKIAPNVTKLDAWVVATGNVNTCDGWIDNVTETRSVNRNVNANATCDNQLQINGPVIAGSVTLKRTYGADSLTYGLGDSGK